MRKLVITFMSLAAALVFIGFYIYQSETSTVYTIAIYWVITILFLTVFGNYIIYRWLNQLMPWEHDALKRVLWQLISSGIYTIICANLSYYLIKTQFTDYPPDGQQMLLLNIYAVFIIIPVFSIFFGVYFMAKWKKATIEMEDAKKEVIKTELYALKNHIDPHFLFNNLNILSSLIDEQNESAQAFLDKFSEVYRYVLQNKDADITRLDMELQFLDAYLYLISTRFAQQIDFSINIDDMAKTRYIPTLSLQMLIENALKHNKFSNKNKLKIDISSQDQHLIIQNSYNPTKPFTSIEESEGSGLKNIEKRYEILSISSPVVEVSNTEFIVKIPLIKDQNS